MTDTPFWSDDFDMDLPKIFPEARELLGDLAEIELYTVGTPDKTTGRLNHPCVWNGDRSMLAFFGFQAPARPEFYAAPSAQQIKCTAWEMFRDAWPHSYLIQVQQRPIWDTFALRRDFETIMWNVRGWEGGRDPRPARCAALRSYREGIRAFGHVLKDWKERR
jgi:hypothetical protein